MKGLNESIGEKMTQDILHRGPFSQRAKTFYKIIQLIVIEIRTEQLRGFWSEIEEHRANISAGCLYTLKTKVWNQHFKEFGH